MDELWKGVILPLALIAGDIWVTHLINTTGNQIDRFSRRSLRFDEPLVWNRTAKHRALRQALFDWRQYSEDVVPRLGLVSLFVSLLVSAVVASISLWFFGLWAIAHTVYRIMAHRESKAYLATEEREYEKALAEHANDFAVRDARNANQ